MDKNVVFFIRAYNDLDHFTPVISRFNDPAIKVIVILTTQNVRLHDYRIKYLLSNQKNIVVSEIRSYHPGFFNILFQIGFRKLLYKYLFQKTHIVLTKLGLLNYSGNAPEISSEFSINRLFKSLHIDSEKFVFCIDHNSDNFTKQVVQEAHRFHKKVIALPHGDANYFGNMGGRTVNFNLNLEPKQKMVDLFDIYILPNLYMYEGQKYDLLSQNKEKIKLLGSPRYNEEWLKIHDDLIPKLEKKQKKRVLILMKFLGWPIFYEELINTLDIFYHLKDFDVRIKFHTRLSSIFKRNKDLKQLINALKEKGMSYYFDELPTSSLINWSDIVIDLGTSAAFEAVVKSKNLISPEYLHPDLTTTAYFFKNSSVLSRDELYMILKKCLEAPNFKTYSSREQLQFMTKIIHFPDSEVLPRYYHLILEEIQ